MLLKNSNQITGDNVTIYRYDFCFEIFMRDIPDMVFDKYRCCFCCDLVIPYVKDNLKIDRILHIEDRMFTVVFVVQGYITEDEMINLFKFLSQEIAKVRPWSLQHLCMKTLNSHKIYHPLIDVILDNWTPIHNVRIHKIKL